MEYRRLPFSQYFIDTSEDFNGTGKEHMHVEYRAVQYQQYGFERLLGLSHEVNYCLCYDEERDVIQIHFQKTNGRSDWFTNIAEFGSRYYDAFPFGGEMLELHVHHGWGNMYKTIKYRIREEWRELHLMHPDAYTEIIGWSLGSGQAMLCCQDLNWNFGVKPYVYTFGSVKPFRSHRGNDELLADYLESIAAQCFNFANRNDLITYMPPFPGFRMIRRRTVGRDRVTPARLLDPYQYHTIYDRKDLYERRAKR